jgi:hypothetical protein
MKDSYRIILAMLIVIVSLLIYLVGQKLTFIKPALDIPLSQEIRSELLTVKKEWRGMTANEIIGKYKQGSIRREFPRQFLDEPVEAIDEMAQAGNKAAQTAMKLLKDNRFNKDDNRK